MSGAVQNAPASTPAREYRRVLLEDLAAAESEGWVPVVQAELGAVGADPFCAGTLASVLVARDALVQTRVLQTTAGRTWVDVSDLGEDEQRVLLRVLDRLRIGYARYGALDLDGSSKDWHKEAIEEHLDGAIYLAMDSLRRDAR